MHENKGYAGAFLRAFTSAQEPFSGSPGESARSSAGAGRGYTPVKRLVLLLTVLALVGCDDTAEHGGYDAGYALACGFSWDAGNKFVVDKEFAHKFLAGVRACAHAHPERARKVLGLAGEEEAVRTRQACEQMQVACKQAEQREPEVAGEPDGLGAEAPVATRMQTNKAPAGAAGPPAKPPAKAVKATKAPPKAAKASPKAARTAPKKAAKPAAKTARATPEPVRAPPKADKAPAKATKGPAPEPATPKQAIQTKRRTQPRRTNPVDSYESFMGN
jgi:hypothetical protein